MIANSIHSRASSASNAYRQLLSFSVDRYFPLQLSQFRGISLSHTSKLRSATRKYTPVPQVSQSTCRCFSTDTSKKLNLIQLVHAIEDQIRANKLRSQSVSQTDSTVDSSSSASDSWKPFQALLASYDPSLGDWKDYSSFDTSRLYTRHLVSTDDVNYTLLLLAWNPGRGSPIHTHAESDCMMRVIEGELVEELFVMSTSVNDSLDNCHQLLEFDEEYLRSNPESAAKETQEITSPSMLSGGGGSLSSTDKNPQQRRFLLSRHEFKRFKQIYNEVEYGEHIPDLNENREAETPSSSSSSSSYLLCNLTRESSALLTMDSPPAYIHDSIGLHAVSNPSPTRGAVSLHLYMPPYQLCWTVSENTGKIERARIKLDTTVGAVQRHVEF